MRKRRNSRRVARIAAAALLAAAAVGIQALSTAHNLAVASAQAGNGAGFVSQSVPSTLQPNERADVSITVVNNGSTTWTATDGYKLGTENPRDNALWTGGTRIYLPDGAFIDPGETYTFEFSITAPSNPGTYNFQWRMVQEGVEWFGAYTRNIAITVEAPTPINASQFIGQAVPASLAPGQSTTVSITMRNTGTTTWTAGGGYKLGTQNPRDNTLWTGGTRIYMPSGTSVAPGETYTFAFSITAPSTPGAYSFQWRMVQEGVEWFGAYTQDLTIIVQAPTNGALFVEQSIPGSLAPGQSTTVSITMRNTGNTTWTTADGYRLGTEGPRDNTLWTGSTRVELPGAISPGQEATFSFSITAPSAAGDYDFQWRMVQDPVEWFGQFTPLLVIQVVQPPRVNDAEFIGQSVPASLALGEAATASITMLNTGTTTWSAEGGYKLGSQNPQDNTLWNAGRIDLPDAISVGPGETYTFEFPITAPSTPGRYDFQWQIVHEGVEWFGDFTPNVVITVGDPGPDLTPTPTPTRCWPRDDCLPHYDAQIVSDTIPTTMIAGQSYPVTITVRNTGRNTWTRDNGYMLGAVDDDDAFASELRIWLPSGVEVQTDETYTFEVEMTAPGYATTLLTDWRMVREGVRWFGEMIRYSVRIVYSVPIPSSTPCPPGGPCPPTPTPPLPGGWLPFPIRPGLWPASAEESRTSDIDGDGIPQLTELQLAQHFFPTVWYDGGEDCSAPGGNPGHRPNLPGRLVFRVRPHPQRPEAIAISFALLYARDCGDTASPSHNGDVEPFAITLEPMADCPLGYGIRSIRTWAHEGTSAEHVDDRVFPVPLCNFGFSVDPTGRSDVVLASENKHGNYLSLDSCEGGDVWMDHCSMTFTAGDVNAWVGFNAGEPGVPRHRDLGLLGFPGEQMWSGMDFCGSLSRDDGWPNHCPGPVENKLTDHFVAPPNLRHPTPQGTPSGTAVPRSSPTPTASSTASPTSTSTPTIEASPTSTLIALEITTLTPTPTGEAARPSLDATVTPLELLWGTASELDLESGGRASPAAPEGEAIAWARVAWDRIADFIDRLLDAWVEFWLRHGP